MVAADRERSASARYGVAAGAIVVCTLLRRAMHPLLGFDVPFLFYFPGLMFAGWYGGFGPGFLATVLSGLLGQFLFSEPRFVLLSTSSTVRLVSFLATGTFISLLNEARHRSARALRQAWQEAEAANRLKDEFLATLSHELRTPLNSIVGWTHILLSPAGRDQLELGLRAIERSALAQVRLVDNLLDVSRMVSGGMSLEPRPTALAPVIEGAVEDVRPAAEAKQIRLRPSLDAGEGIVIADPERLRQAVWNLLANAVKFTDRGGEVDVRLRQEGSRAEIEVADTGVGIPPEFLPHVFERFRQLDSSTTRSQGGLGLGLAIARHLVELHGGTLQARSGGEGQGSTFVVSLPLASPARISADRPSSRPG